VGYSILPLQTYRRDGGQYAYNEYMLAPRRRRKFIIGMENIGKASAEILEEDSEAAGKEGDSCRGVDRDS